MSAENVKVVKRIYRAWGERGSPESSGLLDPQIEWVNPPDAVEPGIRRGIEEFTAAASRFGDTFEDVRLSFDRFVDTGDRVVVLATFTGRGRGSGVEVERDQGYVWTLRGGRAVRFEWFSSAAEALAAAGLSE